MKKFVLMVLMTLMSTLKPCQSETSHNISNIISKIDDRKNSIKIDIKKDIYNLTNGTLVSTLPSGYPLESTEYATVSSWFGMRKHPIHKIQKMHKGIDIADLPGTNVLATGPGKVIKSLYCKGYGNLIVVDHLDGTITKYGHLEERYSKVGDIVEMGETIGTLGNTGVSTGPHLHYELVVNGKPIDPAIVYGHVYKRDIKLFSKTYRDEKENNIYDSRKSLAS